MDVGVDQGEPHGDMARFDDGKYLFKNQDDKFDIDKFNRNFDQYKIKRKDDMQENIQKKLDELNRPVVETPPYKLSMGEIAINTKDAIFNIIDDLLSFKFSWDVITKEHRLFYLGVFLITISLIIYLYRFFMDDVVNDNSGKIIHVHEIKIVPGQINQVDTKEEN